MTDELDALCRQKTGMGEDWSVYEMTVVPMPPKPPLGVQCIGSRHRFLTRGKRKGEKTWTNDNKISVFITAEEYRACFPKKEKAA